MRRRVRMAHRVGLLQAYLPDQRVPTPLPTCASSEASSLPHSPIQPESDPPSGRRVCQDQLPGALPAQDRVLRPQKAQCSSAARRQHRARDPVPPVPVQLQELQVLSLVFLSLSSLVIYINEVKRETQHGLRSDALKSLDVYWTVNTKM